MAKKPASIKDVACRAGVSTAPVSSLFSRAKPVDPALATKIFKASELTSGRSRIVPPLNPDLRMVGLIEPSMHVVHSCTLEAKPSVQKLIAHAPLINDGPKPKEPSSGIVLGAATTGSAERSKRVH